MPAGVEAWGRSEAKAPKGKPRAASVPATNATDIPWS